MAPRKKKTAAQLNSELKKWHELKAKLGEGHIMVNDDRDLVSIARKLEESWKFGKLFEWLLRLNGHDSKLIWRLREEPPHEWERDFPWILQVISDDLTDTIKNQYVKFKQVAYFESRIQEMEKKITSLQEKNRELERRCAQANASQFYSFPPGLLGSRRY